jgi:hypothetical protein
MGWEDDDAKQCREGEGVSFADTRAKEEVRIVLRDSAWIKSGMVRIVMRPKGTCYIAYLA